MRCLLPLWLATFCFLLLPGLRAEEDAEGNELVPEYVFGGAEVLAIVRGAEKVEACRIESDAQTYRKTGKYKVVSKPVALGEKDARELIAVMTDPKIYSPDAKACMTRPGIRFRFHRGGEVVDMPICLECAIFMVDYKGKPVGGQHCDDAVGWLLDLALRLFPGDAGFAELQEAQEAEVARLKDEEEMETLLLDALATPTDGARLTMVKNAGSRCTLQSTSDGSIWFWEEGKGLSMANVEDEEVRREVKIALIDRRYHLEGKRDVVAVRKERREKRALAGTLVSPIAGGKLYWRDAVGGTDILLSKPDGSIWLYTKENGVHEPPANGDVFRDPLALVVDEVRSIAKREQEYEEAKRKELEEKQKFFDTMEAPSDGSRLVWLYAFGSVDIVKSTPDGTVWVHTKGKGLYKPNPEDEEVQKMITFALREAKKRGIVD